LFQYTALTTVWLSPDTLAHGVLSTLVHNFARHHSEECELQGVRLIFNSLRKFFQTLLLLNLIKQINFMAASASLSTSYFWWGKHINI